MRWLGSGQLILLVTQAFHYAGEPDGHVPRGRVIDIMNRRGNGRVRKLAGQKANHSAGYFCWRANGSGLIGLSQRQDWIAVSRSRALEAVDAGRLAVC